MSETKMDVQKEEWMNERNQNGWIIEWPNENMNERTRRWMNKWMNNRVG
jgi:hypothetical protein